MIKSRDRHYLGLLHHSALWQGPRGGQAPAQIHELQAALCARLPRIACPPKSAAWPGLLKKGEMVEGEGTCSHTGVADAVFDPNHDMRMVSMHPGKLLK